MSGELGKIGGMGGGGPGWRNEPPPPYFFVMIGARARGKLPSRREAAFRRPRILITVVPALGTYHLYACASMYSCTHTYIHTHTTHTHRGGGSMRGGGVDHKTVWMETPR